MAFVRTFYEDDLGITHPIRLTEETLAVAGAPPAGPAESNIKAKVSKTSREFGLRPRLVTVARTVGTAPNTFQKYARLPQLTTTAYDAKTIGSSVTYDGSTWEVVGKSGEDY